VLPDAVEKIRQSRHDLCCLEGDSQLFPRRFLHWFAFHAHEEYPIARVVERLTPFIVNRAAVEALAAEIASFFPDLPVEASRRALTTDRFPLLEVVAKRSLGTELWRRVRQDICRHPALQPALGLRLVHACRPDLQATFPDPMGRDFEPFKAWLRRHFSEEYAAPEAVLQLVENVSPTRSLARILAHVRLCPDLNARFRARGIDRPLLVSLLPVLPNEPGFTADDLVVVDWWLEGDAAPRREEAQASSLLARALHALPVPGRRVARSLSDHVTPLTFPENGSHPAPAVSRPELDRGGRRM
jgi:hypothetical protein